jgi:hypothetical protein
VPEFIEMRDRHAHPVTLSRSDRRDAQEQMPMVRRHDEEAVNLAAQQ